MRALHIVVTIFVITLPVMAQNGTVTDTHGVPVGGVEIAQFWLAGSETPSGFRAYSQTLSDATGKFHIQLNHLPTTLFAVDSTSNQGAIVIVSNPVDDIRVHLQPLWRVRYRFEGTDLTNLSQSRIMLKPASGSVFSQLSGPTEGVMLLPAGSYVVAISSAGAADSEVNFEVTNHDVTLAPILLAAGIGQYYGRAAPALDQTEPVILLRSRLMSCAVSGFWSTSGATGVRLASMKGFRNWHTSTMSIRVTEINLKYWPSTRMGSLDRSPSRS